MVQPKTIRNNKGLALDYSRAFIFIFLFVSKKRGKMKKKLINIEDIENMIKKEINSNKTTGINIKSNNLTLTLFLKGREKSWKLRILEHSQKNYFNGGLYNEKRNCYYPKDLSNYKNIAEYNKLEKLFKKWGFNSL